MNGFNNGFNVNGFSNGFNGMNNFMNYQQPMQRQIVPNNFVQNSMVQNSYQDKMFQGMKIVESEKNIENIDVPMDGNPYYFIKADGKEIYAKFWTDEMKTRINKYILVDKEKNEEEKVLNINEVLKNYFETLDKNLSNRIESINENILNLNKPIQKNVKANKEV